MVGMITQSSGFNSFWSVSFCALALCLHGYTTYLAAQRYREASARVWPGSAAKGGPPGEVRTQLTLLVLSCLLLPFFALFSLLRCGNYANDGVKLGRDHALNANLDAWCRKVQSAAVKRVWQNCPPLAQTLYLTAAFLLLLPDVLLTAVEVDYGYKTSDSVWSTDVDFLFSEERAHSSDLLASINLTNTVANGSRVVIPTPKAPPQGWGSDHSLSLAFVNFVLALLTFSIRYASVFWYTNKALTLVFALQLLALTVTAALGYSAWSVLYKVCSNHAIYLNVSLSLSCSLSLGLYLTSSTVMLLSSMTVFQYGSHYFAQKMRIIERKHRSQESLVKQTIVVNSGCQGYVPHSCAMAALVVLAACKGPVMYDLVALYRPTADGLVLTGLVCEVCYMVSWIALWFGLTVKQRWQFRILDYVPLGQPLFMIQDDQVMKNPTFEQSGGSGDGGGSSLEMREAAPRPHRRNRESPPGYLDAVAGGSGDVTPDHDPTLSDAGTEDSDSAHQQENPGDISHLPSGPNAGGAMRKGRPGMRKTGGPRVTFDDTARNKERRASGGGGDEAGVPASRHVNVKVDIHNNNVKPSNAAPAVAGETPHSGETCSGDANVKLRRKNSEHDRSLSREYRNSIRSKCDDFYAVVEPGAADTLNNLSPQTDGAAACSAGDPLPTLMSSFRDKVKESSRTASSYREQQRNLQLGHYGSLERQRHHSSTPAPGLTNGAGSGSLTDLQHTADNKRRGLVEKGAEAALRLDDSLDSGVRSSKRSSEVSGSDDDHNASFPHHHPHYPHKASNVNSTFESDNSSLPSIRENGQAVLVTDKPPRQAAKMDYLSIDKGPHAFGRNLHIVPRTKAEIGRRDSANYSLTSSQETSSNDSDHGQGLCSQV